jgi:hypothetical protein
MAQTNQDDSVAQSTTTMSTSTSTSTTNTRSSHPFFNSRTSTTSAATLATPLAERMRPKEMETFVGQTDILQHAGVIFSFLTGTHCISRPPFSIHLLLSLSFSK